MNEENKNKYDAVLNGITKGLIRFLMGLLTLSLLFGSIDLLKVIIEDLIAPPILLIQVGSLFKIFNLILTIAIGYELFKALHIVVTSNLIPSLPIIQIALIAIANKVITIDTKDANPQILFGLAAIMLALGIAHFCLKARRKGGVIINEKNTES